jgi:tetratricopeptide (TPR) repeat protein
MVEFTKKEAFARQLAIFIRNEDRQRAYELSKEFVNTYPDEMLAHFLLALAAFRLDKFDEAKLEGRKAFNLAQSADDMLVAALLTSSAHYDLGEYTQGYELLRSIEKRKSTDELQKRMFIFAMALGKSDEALQHMDQLFKLNESMAADLVLKMLGL